MQEADPPPTALLCCGDPAALTVLRCARAAGLSVPRDLSVVGYADFTMAEFADPPLTTIAQPFDELGQAAVRRLLERINGPEEDAFTQTRETYIPTRLIIRESTAPPAR